MKLILNTKHLCLFEKFLFSAFCFPDFDSGGTPVDIPAIHIDWNTGHSRDADCTPWIPASSHLFSFMRNRVEEKKYLKFCSLSKKKKPTQWVTRRITTAFIFSCSYSGLIIVFRMSLKPRLSNSQMTVVMICNLPRQDMYLRFLYLAAVDSPFQGYSFQ